MTSDFDMLMNRLLENRGLSTNLGSLVGTPPLPQRRPEAPYFLQEANQIRQDEGYRPTVYLDTENLPTVGVGHLLDSSYAEGDQPYTEQELETLFQEDLEKHAKIVEKVAPNAPLEVKKILTNMAFNLGENRLKGFKSMLKAINAGDYDRAADEMVDSKWYKQVGDRSKRLEQRMRALTANNRS